MRKIGWTSMFAGLMKRLSATLQKAIAQNVNERLVKLLGRSSAANRYLVFRHEAMADEE
jgi:hypothetical protein